MYETYFDLQTVTEKIYESHFEHPLYPFFNPEELLIIALYDNNAMRPHPLPVPSNCQLFNILWIFVNNILHLLSS